MKKNEKQSNTSILSRLPVSKIESTQAHVRFTGKAGEHLVCAELLFRDFNANIISVDVGLDIFATKNGRVYCLQVKTAHLNSSNTFGFDIPKASLEKHDGCRVFYVFVLRDDTAVNYLILPFTEVEKKIHEKAIFLTGKKPRYRASISIRDEGVFLGSRDHKMDYYLNNWGVIK